MRTKPPSGARSGRHLAAVDLDALADADEAVAEARRSSQAPRPSSRDLDLELLGAVADVTSARPARACLSEFVSPSWTIRYAESSTARGSGNGSPSTWSSHRQPGASDALGERVEPVEAGLRRERHVAVLVPHRAEESTHLAERAASGSLDAAERVLVGRELGRELVPDGADLEHHDTDRVGDDVVQLARDPRPLLGDRDARRAFTLALGLRRARLRRFRLLGALAQREAGQPADPEQERGEDELGRGVVRVVVDHERRAAEREHEAERAPAWRRGGFRAGTRLRVPRSRRSR